jgi:hypothetical protein
VAARFLEPVRRDQAARLWDFVDEALRELDVGLDVPLRVVDRHAPDGPILAPGVVAWATARDGVFVCRDALELDDDLLREVVVEETGHYWLARACPRVAASQMHSELFAVWLTGRICGNVSFPRKIDQSTDRYQLGRAAGAALAGASEPREMLAAIGYRDLLALLDRLDGDAEPQDLARQLVAELGGR